MNLGIAYFDSDNVKDGGGWRSLNGEPARRFNGFTDLDVRHTWLTNLNFTEFNGLGLSRTTHLRNSTFFRQSLDQIAADCGFQKDSSIPETVEAVSGITSRALELAKLSMPGLRVFESLSDSIYNFLGLNDVADDPAGSYQPQLQAAFQENSQVKGSYGEIGADSVRLSMNRVDFAEEVLSYPFPTGAWRDERSNMTIDEFINCDVPAIACAAVDLGYADKAELLAFGFQFSGTAVPREWITQPEAAMFKSAGGRIKISNILRGSAINDTVELPPLLTSDPLIRSSYSAGLVAECYVHALTSKRYIKDAKKNAKVKYFFPARAVYLKAVDRMLSYGLARQLSDRNYVVSAYGFGSVTVRATSDFFAEAVKDAAEIGFAIVASKFKE